MSNYFIKRGEKIHGPFTVGQISSGIKSKKLTANDEVSVSENGPWNPLQDFYNTILNNKAAQVQTGSQAPRENQMCIVQHFHLRKNVFGKYTAQYKCPYCKAGLTSGEQDLREGAHCPKCRKPFRFSVDAIAQIESGRQQIREQKEQKSEERRQHQRERQQQLKDEQRQKNLSGLGSDPSVAGQGSLHFQRQTGRLYLLLTKGIFGLLTELKVFVDGQLKSTLAVKQSEQVAVSAGQHEIKVKGGGAWFGGKTTVSVRANSALYLSIKFYAMGLGLQLVPSESPGDSIKEEGSSSTDVADVVDGASTLLDLFGDED